MTQPSRSTPRDASGVAIAVALLALAVLIAFDASRLPPGTAYGLGPAAMPYLVAVGLALVAAGNLVAALRGGLPAREDSDPASILLILGGLAALIAIIGFGGGFIAATAVLFAATAAGFGRRALFADLAIGLVLGLCIYLVFAKLLSISLPTGPLENLL